MGEWRPKVLPRRRSMLSVAVVLLVLAVGSTPGCAGDTEGSGTTIIVSSRNLPEEHLLLEIYAQALEAAGFEVKRHNYEPGVPSEELEKGRISGYPDHLDTALTEATPFILGDVPGSADVAYEEAKIEFAKKGLAPFPPTSVVRTSVVGLLTKTAEQRGLKALTDLKGVAGEMSVQGEYYCRARADCLGGLEHKYGIVFEGFSANDEPSHLYRELQSGATDAAMLVTTDGRLARGKDWLVLLEDEEHRLPAANVFWMTSQDVIDEAGPEYEKAILKAQEGLTLRVMRELNAAVELEGQSPAKVAAEYLKSSRHRG